MATTSCTTGRPRRAARRAARSLERALARAEAALIQADPAGLAPSEVDFAPERTLSLDEDLDVVDLT